MLKGDTGVAGGGYNPAKPDEHSSPIRVGLIDLLEQINKIEGLRRIRLSSISPTIITDDFVKRLSKLDKICDHFHLSLQSGSTETLKRMNRKYTADDYKEKVKLLRNAFPEAAFTTDVIVGFPGETEEEFTQTVKFVKEINFAKMHVFKYSPRKGTKAADMKEQISGEIKEKRSKALIEISNKNEIDFASKQIGKITEVLFEEREGKYIKGHTSNYILVKIESSENIESTIQKVNITGINKGEII